MHAVQAIKFNGVIALDANVEIRHLDRNGKAKPIFQENRIAIALIDRGILSPLWINSRIGRALSYTGILGFWSHFKLAHNLVTTTGKAAMASRCNGSGGEAAFTSIGQGTGTTAANVADTALEIGKLADGTGDSGVHVLPAASVTVSRVTTTVTNDTAQLVGTISEAATLAITESGVFNADTNGTMLCRQVFSAINVVSGDSLQLTWKIKAA